MTQSIKAACGAVALAMVLLGATTAARADIITDKIPSTDHKKPPIFIWDNDPSSSAPSGGAPSPEVSTLVGFLVVAGTVAFIKRRRGAKAEVENAAV